MVRDANMARAIGVLRAGQSNSQQKQAFLEKAIVGALTAGVGVTGGIIQGQESEALQDRQKRRAAETRKAEALKSAPRVPNAPPQENYGNDEYGLPRQMGPTGPSYSKRMDASVQAGNPDWLKERAKEASDTQGVNIAAAGANIGGYRTPSGADDIDMDSDSRAADIQTGKNIMKATEHMGSQMGGMGMSLPRRR